MRDRSSSRPYLSPITTKDRALVCTRCGTLVDLIELPAPWIDPDEYVCGLCLQPLELPARVGPPAPPNMRAAA